MADKEKAMDLIKIENLEVYAYHGVYPEENRDGQAFYINAVLHTDVREAGRNDDLESSTDYGKVCHFMADWMVENTCKLIEAVAERLAEACLLEFPLIRKITLEIRKPQAPVELPFESISVQVERGWHRAYVALGSNMGDREAYLQMAISMLKERADIRIHKISSLIATEPYGGVEQEDFLNGCLCMDTLLCPSQLLAVLHEIENAAGRERKVHWGPRTLDLDIILYDDLVYEDEELIIPHVDMENRRFVLEPMQEIAPNLRHPILKRTMTQLLRELGQE